MPHLTVKGNSNLGMVRMLNTSISLPTRALESARNFCGLEGDVAASVKDNFHANLSRLLADLRDRDGNRITQEEFAARVGVKPQKVSQWKKSVFPRPEQVDAIAAALGVSSEELFRESATVRARDIDTLLRELAAARGFELKPKS